MHLRMANCPVLFLVTVTMNSDLVSRIDITSLFFEVGIPNLVCGCILGWPSLVYTFRVTVTLSFCLVLE